MRCSLLARLGRLITVRSAATLASPRGTAVNFRGAEQAENSVEVSIPCSAHFAGTVGFRDLLQIFQVSLQP
jgi:hypothetical protein